MKRVLFSILVVALSWIAASAKTTNVAVTLSPAEQPQIILPEIYGQFAEHLGRCIYGGLWVGEDSPVPNVNGYRKDVLDALKELHIPVLRWPGGCFADEYHWMDGIGPRENRPVMVNSNWGGTVEDNSFGTHEFFNLCELLETEPYLSGNVGSGTVEELAKWVEYITAENGPMAELRKKNGREKPWHLKYLGVGNESWGCGGNFTADFYSDVYRRYQTYCRDFDGNHLYKIASGANSTDYNWTEVLMKKAGHHMNGLSVHYYAVENWGAKGSATQFTDLEYYQLLARAMVMDELVRTHVEVMDKYDPRGRVGLMVDEWGTWFEVEPGTNPGWLYQQNTMRDAIVAALTLNIFHQYTHRVKMANIAQIANVLQAMVLTNDYDMVLTPTYYVFKMYLPHQGAKHIPLTTSTPMMTVPERPVQVPAVSVTASEKDGAVTISLTNTNLENPATVTIDLSPLGNRKSIAKAEILNANNIADYNDFSHPNTITLKEFKGAKIKDNTLTVEMPVASIVTLTL